MKTAQSMLDSKHELDLALIEKGDLPLHLTTFLDDAILSDHAPSGDGLDFWNYIQNANL